MTPTVVGLDLSLSATGVAQANGCTILAPPGKLVGVGRLAWFRDSIGYLASTGPDLVVVEGYSFGTTHNAHHAGELGGVVLLALFDAGVPVAVVAPSCLKKFATNAGNAKKDAVLVAAVRAGYEGDDNNEADSWILRQMGLYHFGVPEIPITLYRTEAVNKVKWPEVAIKEAV